MNVVKRELRSNLKSVIIWSIAISLIVAMWMIEYKSFVGNPSINDFMASLPQGILNAFGMQELSLNSLSGYIRAISLYIHLLLGIQAILLGSSIISKEERDKTAEYLFSLPISRKKIIAGKTISAFIYLAILNLTTLLTIMLSTTSYDKGESFYGFIGLLFISIFIVQAVFLSIGMFVSSVNKRYKKSGNISVGILMITFLLSSLINMVDGLDLLKFITPFTYFDTTYILEKMSLEPFYLLLSFFIIALGIGGTFFFYPKRDLYI